MTKLTRDRIIVSLFGMCVLVLLLGVIFVVLGPGADWNPQKNPVFAALIGFAAGYVVRGMNSSDRLP